MGRMYLLKVAYFLTYRLLTCLPVEQHHHRIGCTMDTVGWIRRARPHLWTDFQIL
jgi:hypothetical protein